MPHLQTHRNVKSEKRLMHKLWSQPWSISGDGGELEQPSSFSEIATWECRDAWSHECRIANAEMRNECKIP
jgi:hypothetical protein